MSRRKVKTFDPSAELGKLISSLKRKTGIRSEVAPRTSPLALTLRRKTSSAAFSRCIVPRVIAVALRCCSARLSASRVAPCARPTNMAPPVRPKLRLAHPMPLQSAPRLTPPTSVP